MSGNDLIRRGDALDEIAALCLNQTVSGKVEDAICALPAAPVWQDISTAPTEAQREMIKASAQNLLDLLMKRHGLENTVSRDEVQVMWDDVKDEVGFAAVKAFLEAVAILPGTPS